MCLAIPMKLSELRDGGQGVVAMEGATYDVNLSLIENPRVGDYLIVHAGFAIEKLDRAEADERIQMFEELGAVNEE
ncbi:MAG: HypC/HybG/HupF family hydrogenase formation chaperone [Candidatus Pacebacteria bacterium]|nr:HypC/HybG/HupF family hydrogenase formation chaperone [Candidatus Paceibacterota bacterium]